MSSEDLATKAPESDAMAPTTTSSTTTAESQAQAPSSENQSTSSKTDTTSSILPTDTPAQIGLSMGEHCVSDRPLSTTQKPTGDISTINDIECYITKPPTYPHNPSKLLLLLTGGTGIHSINNQLQADAYASLGYVVIMPDQFHGDPAPNTAHVSKGENVNPTSPVVGESAAGSLIEWIKEGVVGAAKSFRIDMWLARHTPEKVLPVLRKVLDGAREEFADAVANGGGIYGVGYCFGAKYILILSGLDGGLGQESKGKEDMDAEKGNKGPELKAGAIAHGTLVTKEDIEGVKSPMAMVCVANDNLFPDDVREQGRASLELNAVEHEIQVFDGCPHGFAVMGDYEDQNIKEKQKQAFELMSKWLEKH